MKNEFKKEKSLKNSQLTKIYIYNLRQKSRPIIPFDLNFIDYIKIKSFTTFKQTNLRYYPYQTLLQFFSRRAS